MCKTKQLFPLKMCIFASLFPPKNVNKRWNIPSFFVK